MEKTTSKAGKIPGAEFARRVASTLCIKTKLGDDSIQKHAEKVKKALAAIGVERVEPEAEKKDEIYRTTTRIFRAYDPNGSTPALVHFKLMPEGWIVVAITIYGPRSFG